MIFRGDMFLDDAALSQRRSRTSIRFFKNWVSSVFGNGRKQQVSPNYSQDGHVVGTRDSGPPSISVVDVLKRLGAADEDEDWRMERLGQSGLLVSQSEESKSVDFMTVGKNISPSPYLAFASALTSSRQHGASITPWTPGSPCGLQRQYDFDERSLKSHGSVLIERHCKRPGTRSADHVESEHSGRLNAESCPVCFESLDEYEIITCGNGHDVCVDCARQMVQDSSLTTNSSGTTGFSCACPICRIDCILGMHHLRLMVKGTSRLRETLKLRTGKSGKVPTISTSNLIVNFRGFTTTCVNCRKYGIDTCSVNTNENIVGLCCADGHSLCVECSRDLVRCCDYNDFKAGKCSVCCGHMCGSGKPTMAYICPECDEGAMLNRRHIMVVVRGYW